MSSNEESNQEHNPEWTLILSEARLALQKGDVRRARTLLESELRRDPDNYEILDLEVEALVASSEADLAVRLLEEYQRFYPENDHAAARMGWLLWKQEKNAEAMAELKAVLSRNPSCLYARRWIVEMLSSLDDLEEVINYGEKGLEDYPQDKQLLVAVGTAYARQKKEIPARELFLRALELDEDANTILAYGEFLLELNHTGEAAKLLTDHAGYPGAPPMLALRAVEACFRSNAPKEAFDFLERLVASPEADKDEVQRELLALLYREGGTQHADEFGFRHLSKGSAVDAFGVEFLEHCGARQNRSHLTKIFTLTGQRPLQYPRTLARFLSTFYSAPMTSGTIGRWVKANHASIQQNSTLWGGVGAWYVATKRFREAVDHLSSHESRHDAAPWMLLLLGKAQEQLGYMSEANAVYRHALTLKPDHSESGLRSRLAYNLALERMPGAGSIIAMDCSERGKMLATIEDMARLTVVESMSQLHQSKNPAENSAIVHETLSMLKSFSKTDPGADIGGIRKNFLRVASHYL